LSVYLTKSIAVFRAAVASYACYPGTPAKSIQNSFNMPLDGLCLPSVSGWTIDRQAKTCDQFFI